MWDTRSLEKMVNRTTLSTQRVLHKNILDLEEQSSPCSSLNPKTDKHLKSPLKPVIGWDKPDTPALEEFKMLAEKEKHTALRLQEESLRARFQEALRARDRLEAEVRLELQVELQGVFRAHCDNLRAQREEKKVQAVGEACRKLRDQLEKEAEEDRERIIQALRKENQEHVRMCVQEAVKSVCDECDMKAERERHVLQDKHAEEISELHDRLRQLQDSLEKVCRERVEYEAEFKKVQASYRRFVDLTDSSLHSDYLLKLRRLGREPGLTDTSSQTDDITPEL
ncbi:uncharacterized protein si:dkey-111f13.5 isoform X1 [Triplophysa dalaica]|uniref:uncharacterized protein si:dkey-111f13.5 isoform X1 n=1 Tax=Triplophysa dalaica TaxID=1582913 RepID=UPI0024DF3D11|nr:uncharacterized protein si:dkey-111f13.5 isoform X1 [Triplophysa dalaica]